MEVVRIVTITEIRPQPICRQTDDESDRDYQKYVVSVIRHNHACGVLYGKKIKIPKGRDAMSIKGYHFVGAEPYQRWNTVLYITSESENTALITFERNFMDAVDYQLVKESVEAQC